MSKRYSGKSFKDSSVSKKPKLSLKENFKPVFPPQNLCGDNAAMIAMVGLEKFRLKKFNKLNYPAKPRWPLDKKASFLKDVIRKLNLKAHC